MNPAEEHGRKVIEERLTETAAHLHAALVANENAMEHLSQGEFAALGSWANDVILRAVEAARASDVAVKWAHRMANHAG